MKGVMQLGVPGAIAVIGVLTVVHAYLILGYGLDGLRSYPVEPALLALSGLPSVLFLGASLLRRRSMAMQCVVTAAATLVGILFIGTIWYELSRPFISSRTGPGTGMLSYMAWMFGVAVAVGVLLIAAGAAVYPWLRRTSTAGPSLPPRGNE